MYETSEKIPALPPLPSEPDPPQDEPVQTPPQDVPPAPREANYNDESVATENYYEEKENERGLLEKACENAHAQSTNQEQSEKAGSNPTEDGNAAGVRGAFKTDPDGYYLAVKEEVDRLFEHYPRDATLLGAFSCSEWVRVKGTAKDPQYLVGVLREDGRVRYICYALAAEDKNSPPEEIKNVCAFVPLSVYEEDKGFFVIFQSAASGECVRPERA